MAGIKLSGLITGTDWASTIDKLMELERIPVTRLEKEKTTNEKKSNALDILDTKMGALQNASKALKESKLYTGRSASSTTSGSTWKIAASTGSAVGTYKIDVKHLATETKLTGTSDIGKGLFSSDVDRTGAIPGSSPSGLTLGTLNTAVSPTAGTFTINGKQISVALTDSLEGVFQKIYDATEGNVSAAYDTDTDTFTLQAATGTITLGAANDTSNFLTVAKLANNNTGTIQSNGRLGTTDTRIALASANLNTSIGADENGDGSFRINGVSIDYNVNTDSLAAILDKITTSSAGVTASYDAVADRVVFTNKTTGSTGIYLEDVSGGLVSALGLGSGTTLELGTNAEFSVNGGASLFSTSNTLDASAHGIQGLSITADTESAQTIKVSADTTSTKTAIETFISKYNDVQDYIDQQTRTTSTNGKVTTSTLTSNREIQEWSRKLRSLAFSSLSGLSGGVDQLADIGIDFTSNTNKLEVKDSTKFASALETKANDLVEFFTSESTGFISRLDTYLTTIVGTDTKTGLLDSQKTALTNSNTSIDKQIEELERRLTARRETYEESFNRLETAQSKANNTLSQLSKISS